MHRLAVLELAIHKLAMQSSRPCKGGWQLAPTHLLIRPRKSATTCTGVRSSGSVGALLRLLSSARHSLKRST